MSKNILTAVGKAAASFVGHGHAAMFLLLPLLGVVGKVPSLNLFTGTTAHQLVATLPMALVIFAFTMLQSKKDRPMVAAWLGTMTAYSWLAASVVTKASPVVFWSPERGVLDLAIMAPIGLWLASAAIATVAFIVSCTVIATEPPKAKPSM